MAKTNPKITPQPHAIAAWRFAQLSPFLDPALGHAQRRRVMRERVALTWPDGTRKRVPRSSLHRWLAAFRRHGYQGLLPKQRRDLGKPRVGATAHVDYAIGLLLEQPRRSLQQLQIYLAARFPDYALSRATLHRRLSEHPTYPAIEQLRTGTAEQLFHRYEAACPHECWQLDGKGPFTFRLQSGARIRVYVLSVLDDHSRAILAAHVASNEDTTAAIAVFQKAVLRYGLPTRMQFDRGSAFDSEAFRGGLAQCGVHRNFVRSKQPTAQGKVEAYHRWLGRWFLAELATQAVVDAAHLQQLLDAALALLYQSHQHRILGCSPAAKLAGKVADRQIAPQDLYRAFFVETVKRSHKKTGEVQLPNGRFQVPIAHAGSEVRCRFDPLRPVAVLVTRHGQVRDLVPFAPRPLPAPRCEQEPRGEGPLQRLLDQWRNSSRHLAPPGFGLPEVIESLALLVGRRVPDSEAEALAISTFYKEYGPIAQQPWRVACKRTRQALGEGKALKTCLEDLARQIRRDRVAKEVRP
ncbi:MAG: transposase [Planctomycetes bacterium]|nr:transposase [Planctomycetota bacterium]